MAGIPLTAAIDAALQNQLIATEFSVRALRTQLNTAEQIGAEAIQLIQAASIDPNVGRNLDVSA